MKKFRITEGQGAGTEFEALTIVKARSTARKMGFRFCEIEEIREKSEAEKAWEKCRDYMFYVEESMYQSRKEHRQTDFFALAVTGDAGDCDNSGRKKPDKETILLGYEYAKELGISAAQEYNRFFGVSFL